MFTETMPNIYIANIDNAVAFYRDLLGFEQTYRFPVDGPARHVEMRLGESRLALTTNTAIDSEGLRAHAPGNPLELVIWCHDVDGAVEQLRRANTTVLHEPYDHAAGHRRAYVTDPDGTWIALVS